MEPTPASAIMRTVGYCVSLSVFLITNLTICGKAPGLIGIIFLTWLPFTCVIWGVIYLRFFSCPPCNWVNVEDCLIAGFWLASLALLAPIFFSPSLHFTVFVFTIWNGIAVYFLFQKPGSLRVLDLRLSNLWLLLVIGLSMSLWSQTGIIQKIVSSDHITFLPWSDHFVHASIIQRLHECSRLGTPQEFAMMSGILVPLYHYGSYLIPSVLRALSDIPAINISTAFWLPFGSILSGLGAFVLGAALWRKMEGIACALVIVLLPDPFMYGCGLGYFSYQFLGQTGAALYYAEAIAAVGLSLVGRGIAAGNNRQILAGLIPILTLVFFKAHVFLIAFPATCLWTTLFSQYMKRITRTLWILGLIACPAMISLVSSHMGYIAVENPWALEFFRGIFAGASPHDPWIYTWLFGLTQQTMTIWDDVVVGTILMWFAALGPLLIIGLALVVCLGAKKRLNFVDALPFLCLGVWTALVLIMPANHYGNFDEFHHRPFHVVYYIFVIWLIGRSCNLLFEKADQWKHKATIPVPKLKIVLVMSVLGLLVLPWYFGKNVLNIGPCAERHQNFKIDKGLWESTEFIRTHGKPGEIFLDSREDNLLNFITGVSERRPFLSEPYHLFVSRHRSGSGLIEQRQKLHEELKKCDSAECVNRIASNCNTKWYLAHPEDGLTWESNLNMKPVFEFRGYRVFDFYRSPRVYRHNQVLFFLDILADLPSTSISPWMYQQ